MGQTERAGQSGRGWFVHCDVRSRLHGRAVGDEHGGLKFGVDLAEAGVLEVRPTRRTLAAVRIQLLAERGPGAGRRKGTYPGRISETISFTVIVSNIGEGSAMDKIESFFTDASRMLGEVQHKREGRQKQWETTSKAAAKLPNL